MKFIKENMRLIIAIVIAVILIIAGVILLNINNDKQKEPIAPQVEEKTKEEQIVEATGMTGDMAIAIVTENFGSDNYTFKYEVTDDRLYKVTVTNEVDKTEIIYFVDPTNGMAYIDMETK